MDTANAPADSNFVSGTDASHFHKATARLTLPGNAFALGTAPSPWSTRATATT